MACIPEVTLSSGSAKPMPLVGMGTAVWPRAGPDAVRSAILHAIGLGYRHFDTAAIYESEEPLGEAIAEALRSGLIRSREELFITSKLWCSDAHRGRVVPALRNTLQNLGLEYLDLYLVHWPLSSKPGRHQGIIPKEEMMPFDMKTVWEGMEECQRLGLTKAIGVSNFSCKKLETLLSFATIPPAANQVEVNPLWQQKKLRDFCAAKGIQICAYSPLGAKGTLWGSNRVMECEVLKEIAEAKGKSLAQVEVNPLWQQKKLRDFCAAKGIQICAYSPLGAKGTLWGSNRVMECEVLKEIAEAKGKSLAQICLRWVYEQGDCVLVKSFNKKRMKENLDILDWELTEAERVKISQISQVKGCAAELYVSSDGPYKSLEEL